MNVRGGGERLRPSDPNLLERGRERRQRPGFWGGKRGFGCLRVTAQSFGAVRWVVSAAAAAVPTTRVTQNRISRAIYAILPSSAGPNESARLTERSAAQRVMM